MYSYPPDIPVYNQANNLLFILKSETIRIEKELNNCPFLCFYRSDRLIAELSAVNKIIFTLEQYFDDVANDRFMSPKTNKPQP